MFEQIALYVKAVPRSEIKEFVELHHYSHSINGLKVSRCYGLYRADDSGDTLVGALIFGPLSTTAWKKYADNEGDVVELRRMVVLDEMPRNTGSWFLARALKLLKKETKFTICVSYADPFHGHAGYIYQATNWKYHGCTASDVLLQDTTTGKLYHSRALRTKYKGKLKPFAERLCCLRDANLLVELKVPGKHIYTMRLKRGEGRVLDEYPYPKLNNP